MSINCLIVSLSLIRLFRFRLGTRLAAVASSARSLLAPVQSMTKMARSIAKVCCIPLSLCLVWWLVSQSLTQSLSVCGNNEIRSTGKDGSMVVSVDPKYHYGQCARGQAVSSPMLSTGTLYRRLWALTRCWSVEY